MPDGSTQTISSNRNGINPLLVVVVILAIFIAGSAAYLGFTGGFGNLLGFARTRATPSPTPNSPLARLEESQLNDIEIKSFRLAKQIVDDYAGSKLLVKSSLNKVGIVHVFRGQLTAMDPGKSWTVEENGRRVVLHALPEVQVKYTQGGQNIGSSQLKVGNTVTVRATIDFTKGILYVKSINIKAQSSLQTPAPSPQPAQ